MSVGTKNVRSREFHKLLAELPPAVQRAADEAYRFFQKNPDHPALRRHALKDTHRGRHREGSWSVSVTMRYRALYFVDGDTNVWYWIGSHADFDSLAGEKS